MSKSRMNTQGKGGPPMSRFYAPDHEPGCTCTAATKLRADELEILDAMADTVGLSRYRYIREILRQQIEKVTK